MLAADCSLLTAHYSPLTADRPPLTADRPPPTAHRPPLTADRSPLTCSLLRARLGSRIPFHSLRADIMSSRPLAPTPRTYVQLRDAVIAVAVKGRQAVELAKLRTYHETGRLINEHILLFRDRADYGAKVYTKLEADTGIVERTLRQCAQFQRCYPIWSARSKLGWSHYRLLISVADPAKRKAFEAEAIKRDWNSEDLETRVRSHNAIALASDDPDPVDEKPVELLKPRRGVAGLLRVVERFDGLALDLGFKNYAAITTATKARLTAGRFDGLTAGDIVRWDADGVFKIPDATPAHLFTYSATVRKIVDGDTLDIAIALAPGFTRDLRLRLRGLDCPELETAAGRAAKAFVETLLAPGDEVTLCTTKPDKYDRYLADVYIGKSAAAETLPPLTAGRSPLTAEGSTFLNNVLLSTGHAIHYDGGAKED